MLFKVDLQARHHQYGLKQVTMTIVGTCSKGPAKQHSGTFVKWSQRSKLLKGFVCGCSSGRKPRLSVKQPAVDQKEQQQAGQADLKEPRKAKKHHSKKSLLLTSSQFCMKRCSEKRCSEKLQHGRLKCLCNNNLQCILIKSWQRHNFARLPTATVSSGLPGTVARQTSKTAR